MPSNPTTIQCDKMEDTNSTSNNSANNNSLAATSGQDQTETAPGSKKRKNQDENDNEKIKVRDIQTTQYDTWLLYWSALLNDLQSTNKCTNCCLKQDNDASNNSDSNTRLADVIIAVIQYKSHLASFYDIGPGFTSKEHRQVSPLDMHDPEVYYRSQDKGHPQINIYKEGSIASKTIKTTKKLTKAMILAPYRLSAYELMKSVKGKTPFKDSVKVNIDDKKTSRKPKVHTESIAGHSGLRKTNPDILLDMVNGFLKRTDGIESLIKFLKKQIEDCDLSALEINHNWTISLDNLFELFDLVMDTYNLIGYIEGQQTADWFLSATHVTRKIEQATIKASYIEKQLVNHLTYLNVKLHEGNPQLMIEIIKFNFDSTCGNPDEIKEATDYEWFACSIRTYLAALIAKKSAEAGLVQVAMLRQSFGFLDTTLANTSDSEATSIRLSLGTEPDLFLDVIVDSLKALDKELEKLKKELTSIEQIEELFGKNGVTRKLKAVSSPNNALFSCFYSINNEKSDLQQHLAYIRNTLYGSKETDKRAEVNKEYQKAVLKLKSICNKVNGQSSEVISLEGFPILEPLSNILLICANTITMHFMEFSSCELFSSIRKQVLIELEDQVLNIRNAILKDNKIKTEATAKEKSQMNEILRNATEELGESLLILIAGHQRLVINQIPDYCVNEDKRLGWARRNNQRNKVRLDEIEQRIKNDLLKRIGTEFPINIFRTDSGEQAGAIIVINLLLNEYEELIIETDDARTYFEFVAFFKDHSIASIKKGSNDSRIPNVLFIDPRPYINVSIQPVEPNHFVTYIKKRTKENKSILTVILDLTNIDYTDQVVINLIKDLKNEIRDNRVRFSFFYSGAKHYQQSLDKYQYGHIINIGKEVKGYMQTTNNSLVTNLLHLLQDLRDLDQDALDELESFEGNNMDTIEDDRKSGIVDLNDMGDESDEEMGSDNNDDKGKSNDNKNVPAPEYI